MIHRSIPCLNLFKISRKTSPFLCSLSILLVGNTHMVGHVNHIPRMHCLGDYCILLVIGPVNILKLIYCINVYWMVVKYTFYLIHFHLQVVGLILAALGILCVGVSKVIDNYFYSANKTLQYIPVKPEVAETVVSEYNYFSLILLKTQEYM